VVISIEKICDRSAYAGDVKNRYGEEVEAVHRGHVGHDGILGKKLEQLSNGVNRLREALLAEGLPEDMKRDAVIQRFEFCFESAWKTLKAWLRDEGIETASPKSALREAYKLGWLGQDPDPWYQMLTDRNLTSHVYNEEMAAAIYANIRSCYANLLAELVDRLGENFDDA
jgi:nucleotidyltransferase substrate binding protein (TIGR01987 family)